MKVSRVLHLPEYLRQLRHDINDLYKLLRELNHQVRASVDALKQIDNRFARLDETVERIQARTTDLEHGLRAASKPSAAPTVHTAPASSADLFATKHELDAFYLEFENRFRGSEAEIKQKQQPYIKVFDKTKFDRSLPVADLGCGRGEFLELLTEHGFKALGVDLNEAMVARARKQGHEAVQNDGISFLMSQKSGSLGGVTGFHLAEHIPFEDLLTLIAEAYRCLAKGGVLLLETPNPESVFVGAFTFHYDPSHLKPLPPAIVEFAAQFKGFRQTEIMRLQPELTKEDIAKATKNTTLQGALQRLYGPRDYALVAYK